MPLADHEQIGEVGRLLFDRGIYVTLAAYPLVPRDEVGFRIQVTAANTDAEIDRLILALTDLADRGLLQTEAAARGAGRMSTIAARSSRRPALWMLYPAAGALVRLLYAFVPPVAGNGFVVPGVGLSCSVMILIVTAQQAEGGRAWSCSRSGSSCSRWATPTRTSTRACSRRRALPVLGRRHLPVASTRRCSPASSSSPARRNPSGERASLIDSLILTIGLGVISWLV